MSYIVFHCHGNRSKKTTIIRLRLLGYCSKREGYTRLGGKEHRERQFLGKRQAVVSTKVANNFLR